MAKGVTTENMGWKYQYEVVCDWIILIEHLWIFESWQVPNRTFPIMVVARKFGRNYGGNITNMIS